MTMHLFLLILLLAVGIAALCARNMLFSALSLALSSVVLSLIMFNFGAPWAAVFELSVCAGLITVLFVSVVSLVRKEEEFLKESRIKFYFLPVAVGIFGVALSAFGGKISGALTPSLAPFMKMSVGDMIWRIRPYDVVGQILMILSGALIVKTFFGGKKNG